MPVPKVMEEVTLFPTKAGNDGSHSRCHLIGWWREALLQQALLCQG